MQKIDILNNNFLYVLNDYKFISCKICKKIIKYENKILIDKKKFEFDDLKLFNEETSLFFIGKKQICKVCYQYYQLIGSLTSETWKLIKYLKNIFKLSKYLLDYFFNKEVFILNKKILYSIYDMDDLINFVNIKNIYVINKYQTNQRQIRGVLNKLGTGELFLLCMFKIVRYRYFLKIWVRKTYFNVYGNNGKYVGFLNEKKYINLTYVSNFSCDVFNCLLKRELFFKVHKPHQFIENNFSQKRINQELEWDAEVSIMWRKWMYTPEKWINYPELLYINYGGFLDFITHPHPTNKLFKIYPQEIYDRRKYFKEECKYDMKKELEKFILNKKGIKNNNYYIIYEELNWRWKTNYDKTANIQKYFKSRGLEYGWWKNRTYYESSGFYNWEKEKKKLDKNDGNNDNLLKKKF